MVMNSLTTPKILVVEDDFAVRNLIHRYLKKKYQVESVADGMSALIAFEQFNPELVILDWNLPDINGYKLCQEMQSRTNVLVMMLTCRTEEADKIKILAAGADDFMSKPFSLAEVEVRTEVLLRRILKSVNQEQTQHLIFKQLAINPESRTVTFNDRPINLTSLEFDILHFFACHPNKAWNREQLIKKIWGCEHMGDGRVVDVHIGQIRKKIKEIEMNAPEFIKTVRSYGYKFEP